MNTYEMSLLSMNICVSKGRWLLIGIEIRKTTWLKSKKWNKIGVIMMPRTEQIGECDSTLW